MEVAATLAAPAPAPSSEWLLDFTLRNRDSSAEDLRQALFKEIDLWSAGQDPEDDQTLVIVRALSSTPPAHSLSV